MLKMEFRVGPRESFREDLYTRKRKLLREELSVSPPWSGEGRGAGDCIIKTLEQQDSDDLGLVNNHRTKRLLVDRRDHSHGDGLLQLPGNANLQEYLIFNKVNAKLDKELILIQERICYAID